MCVGCSEKSKSKFQVKARQGTCQTILSAHRLLLRSFRFFYFSFSNFCAQRAFPRPERTKEASCSLSVVVGAIGMEFQTRDKHAHIHIHIRICMYVYERARARPYQRGFFSLSSPNKRAEERIDDEVKTRLNLVQVEKREHRKLCGRNSSQQQQQQLLLLGKSQNNM